MAQPVQITVGGPGPFDPAPGSTSWADPDYAGITGYLEREGLGTMPAATYSIRPTGGANLVGNVFAGGEIYFFHPTGIDLQTAPSSYTNGFNYAYLVNKLFGRIGWKQPTIAGSPVLNTANTTSTSGRYFNGAAGFHAMLTVENIISAMEDPLAGTVAINDYLTDLQTGAIFTLLNGVLSTPQLIDSTMLFERSIRNDIPLQNFGKFCGYRIRVAPGEFTVQLSKVSFIFSGNANFNFYVFHDMRKAPIFTQAVSVVGNDQVPIELHDCVLKYADNDVQGGIYYAGYFQNDIGGVQAFDEFVSKWNDSLAFGYTGFEAVQSATADFNRINVPYAFKTYGMNLEIQSYRDFTNKVVRNPGLFDEALGLMVAILALEVMAYSTRSNKNQRMTKELASQIYIDINNSESAGHFNPYVAGLVVRLEREMNRIRDTFLFNKSKRGVFQSTRPPIFND